MTDINNEHNRKAAKVITFAALTAIFSYSFVVAIPSALVNYVVYEFGLVGAGEGIMASLVNVGFMLSLVIVPIIAGRVQKITIIIFACAMQAVILLAGGFSPTFFIFGTVCVLLGVVAGFIDASSNSVIIDVRKSESPKYLGYLHGLFGVGSLLAPMLFLWLLLFTDWRGIFYFLAAISLLVVLLIYMIVRKSANKEVASETKEHKAELIEYLRSKRNITLALAGVFVTFSWAGVPVWIVRYMTISFDAADLGAIALSAFWLCATANRFLMSQLVKRAPLKFFVLGSALFAVVLTIGVMSSDAIVLLVAVGLLGFCGGHFVPVLVSECAVGYEGKTGFTTSFIMFVTGISRIIAPLLIAYIATQLSTTFSMLISAITAIIAAFFAILAIRYSK